MGIRPFKDTQPDFPAEHTGQIISSYFGGRAEVRLRKEIAEVAHCDFKSMYPTVCALQHLWRFVTAEGVLEEDATTEIRTLLQEIAIEDLADQAAWGNLAVLVQVAPDADFLPVRAQFSGREQYGLAQSYLSSSTAEEPWFTLADCIASKLRTGKAPRVVRAVRYRPAALQPALRPLAIAGNAGYTVDPNEDDFYVRLIDLRSQVKRAAAAAEQAGDLAVAERLNAEQQSLKIIANATSYGIFIELNPHELDERATTSAWGLDGRRFDTRVRRHEQPGRYFHPLLATLITGAARLMLTLAELKASEVGLDWALCDTDSLVLTRANAVSRDSFHRRVSRVQAWFAPLNPYQAEGDLLELENTNFRMINGTVTDDQEPLFVYAISPKRYVLFNIDDRGGPVIRKGSAHGLGHLLDPYQDKDAPPDIPSPAQPLYKLELHRWQYDLWYRVIEAALDGRAVDVGGMPNLDRPAMARCSITTPTIASWFRRHNRGKPYAEKARPFGFLITPTVRNFDKPLGNGGQRFHLVGPYEREPARWEGLEYVDIYSNETFGVSTGTYDHASAKVQSYADHARRYIDHPDSKRLGPDGKQCRRDTVGLLSPRHIDAFHIEQLGKEANRLEEVEAGLVHDQDEVYTVYRDQHRDPWKNLALPVLRAMPRPKLLQAGILKESALREVLAGRARPRADKRHRLTQLAVGFARNQLEKNNLSTAGHPLAILYAYTQAQPGIPASRTCPSCGATISRARATYCSDACRQAAYRNRSRHLTQCSTS